MPLPIAASLARGPRLHDVYDVLRSAILNGQLRPGEAMSETKTAAQFGVSRTPIRDAFRRLSDDGFLRIVPQVGTYVAPIQLEAVADSQFVRETLECRTIRLAAERMDLAHALVLDRHLAEQERAVAANDTDSFFASDEAMHADLIRIAGRPAVWNLIQDVKAQLDRVRCLSLQSTNWLAMIFEQHRTLIDRTRARDADGAEEAMRAHLRTVFDAIERIAATNSEYFEDDRAQPAR
ncbi:GntR family transcriptional regulator [Azospirillum doebereinerae]|uniref:GntR family transcriptional regulator n=1 Tax=Azospirillum doebereinerae TaxID=92933 RepID=UPI001EE56062|nr:GntR family transcriptional regulator [Azospirillum doebereinerae]MCG5242939.1 GntR family transcriptional regulator [Azospirillum doebereinerae]